MRWTLLISMVSLGLCANSQALVLEGTYCGKDLYFQNPFDGEGKGFCVDSILVNGKLAPDDIKSSAFVISLAHLKEGDRVKLEVYHHPNCRPKLLTPEPCPQKGVEFFDLKLEEKN